jgi:hypothetical protein
MARPTMVVARLVAAHVQLGRAMGRGHSSWLERMSAWLDVLRERTQHVHGVAGGGLPVGKR